MISSEDKRAFLENVLLLASDQGKSEEAQAKLNDFVLKYVNDGKFYKYRTFDEKGRSLDNLKSGTLFCAQPSNFNDPFDFKIGTNISSVFDAKYENELSDIEILLEKYIKYQSGVLNLDNCSEAEQKTIDAISKSEKLNAFLKHAYEFCDSKEEVIDYLKQHLDVLYDFLNIIINEPQLNAALKISKKLLPEIQNALTTNDLLNMSENDYSFSDFAHSFGINDDSDEIGYTIGLSNMLQPENKENAEKAEQMLNFAKDALAQKLNETFKIGCLSTSSKNRLMWSHYADGHKGFCIEYDFKNCPKDLLPLPVIYSQKRPLIPWEMALDQSAETKSKCILQMTIGLLTKDKEWEYEDEWRLLLSSSEDSNIKIPISAIYLGAEISEENKKRVVEICNQKSIPVKQMVIDRGEYRLHVLDVPNKT